MSNRVLAIDFETSNSNRSSACSIGIALLEDGEITINKEILIDPEEHFSGFNISIHGIRPEMVKGADTFPKVWEEVSKLIDDNTLIIAHNASFDMSVLRYVCDKYQMKYPTFDYACTRVLGKKIYEELRSVSLDTIARYLDIDFEHHKAKDDALVCLKVYNDILSKSKYDNVDDLLNSIKIQKGKLFEDGYRPCGSKK